MDVNDEDSDRQEYKGVVEGDRKRKTKSYAKITGQMQTSAQTVEIKKARKKKEVDNFHKSIMLGLRSILRKKSLCQY